MYLPVSSRAVGFTIRALMLRLFRLIPDLDFKPLFHSLYRVALLQFEYKLQCAMKNQATSYRGSNFTHLEVEYGSVSKLSSLGAGFSPIMNFIASLGTFKGFGTTYIPDCQIIKP